MTKQILTPLTPAVNRQPPATPGQEDSFEPPVKYSPQFLDELVAILEGGELPDHLWMYRRIFVTRRARAWFYLHWAIGGELI